jgi:hypothetical protein
MRIDRAFAALILTAFYLTDCAQIQCSRKSHDFKCQGIGKFSDTVLVCDLAHQVCQYEGGRKPMCVEKIASAVICNDTNEIKCACDYNDNGYPFCACADRGTLKKLSMYSRLGISACIILLLICCGIFTYRYTKRRQKRLNRPLAPPQEEHFESPPPSYEAAVRLTED